MLKLYLCTLVILILFSCASGAPKLYPSLEEARLDQVALTSEQGILEVSSVTLFQVDEYLRDAEHSLQENDISNTDHYIYLARQKQAIAKELLLKFNSEQERTKLKQQKQEMIAHARSMESKRAYNETQTVQQRVKFLEHSLGQYQVEETSRGTLLIINDLLFAAGGTDLEPESSRRIEPLLQYLQGNPKREIIIEGHTDSTGNANENIHLSQQRADAVRQFLISRGIDISRIETRGFGEEVPVATNTTKVGRKLNRRVEVVIKTAAYSSN